MRIPSLYRRLWLAGAAMALFLATLIVGNSFLKADQAVRRNMLGYDFRALYIAGTFAREGRSSEFYDLKSVGEFDDKIARDHGLDLDQGIGPIFNPPFFAWIFAPLAGWPYPIALRIWYAISVGCLMLSVLFLGRILSGKSGEGGVGFSGRNRSDIHGLIAGKIPSDEPCENEGFRQGWHGHVPMPVMAFDAKNTGRGTCPCHPVKEIPSAKADPTQNTLAYGALILLLVATSMPAVQALVHAQNTFLSLLMLIGVVRWWRSGRAFLAGLLAGLLFYKPQLGAVVALSLVVTMGWRAALGLAITGTSLLLLNIVTLPGSLTDFFVKMPVNLRWLQEGHIYAWQRHATFQGFWRTLLQWGQAGPATGAVRFLTYGSMLIVAIGLVRLIRLFHRQPRTNGVSRPDAIDPFIAATLTAMPLLMPFYFDYDLLLLSIAAVLTAGDFLRQGRRPNHFADRWLPTAWFIFYTAMYLNLPIARFTHISPLVPSLGFLTVLMFSRATTRLKNMEIGEPFSVPDDMIVSQ